MTLSRRLLLLGALPAVLMFIVLMAFFTSVRLDDARNDMSRNSQMLADNLAPVLEYAIFSGNRFALEQVLAQSLQHSDADWIKVTDVIGEELGFVSKVARPAEAHRDHGFNVYEAEILQEPLALGDDNTTHWYQSGWNTSSGAVKVGTVQVGITPKALEIRQRNIWWSSIMVGGGMLLLIILLINVFLGNILRPMQQLVSRVEKLIVGDYSVEPVVRKGVAKEIADIQEQLNQLAQHLKNLQTARDHTLAISETARDNAEHASRVKSEFLSTMSHELRTPLLGVLGMIDHIKQEPLSTRQSDYLNTAKQSAQDLLTVISDMLDYANLNSGSMAVDAKIFDLRTLFTNCIASYRHAAEQQELALDLHFLGDWPETPLVVGDAPRVRQVLAGLLDNSLELTNDGFISVRTNWVEVDSGHVLITCTVRDSSTSMMASGNLHSAFTSSDNHHGNSTSTYGGAGFNLSLVQRLVELMGGYVHLESDMGQGSSFRFEIPFDLPGKEDFQEHENE
ncbi:sensor histidine kinase [Marinobacter sp.]|uniref:sensor histidine kinase n=1 Tax=Marinobacter sp. TaxID=50741 RepID=UPI003569C3BF